LLQTVVAVVFVSNPRTFLIDLFMLTK
jgi:hypothetical protein